MIKILYSLVTDNITISLMHQLQATPTPFCRLLDLARKWVLILVPMRLRPRPGLWLARRCKPLKMLQAWHKQHHKVSPILAFEWFAVRNFICNQDEELLQSE